MNIKEKLEGINQSSESEKQLLIAEGETLPSMSYSVNCLQHLTSLMVSVTEKNITPQTVNAACNCASQIYKIMDLNLKYAEKHE